MSDALTNKYAWLHTRRQSSDRLHYCPGVTFETWDSWWDEGSMPGYGAPELDTACGRRLAMTLPGLFSRMGMPRCAHCCDRLGIPRGAGAPLNDLTLRGAG